jgi:hypothetical protein
MRTVHRGVVLLLAAAAAGCAGPSEPTVPLTTAGGSRIAADAGGRQQAVTGHANIFLSNFQAEEKYSSNAIRHSDGSVSGEFELKSEQDAGVRLHGDVVCFTVVGNTARVAGFVDSSTEPSFEGLHVVWTVVDNGEGANDPPDLTSDFFLVVSAASAQFHCDVGFAFTTPIFPVLSGNLQVHH